MTATVDDIYAQAELKAAANPPGRVLATVILAVFTAIGWCCGKLWTGIWFTCMAFMYGVRQGSGVPRPVTPPPAVDH
ncbi:MAG TPA: hypothetical protein VHE33_09000 [Acidobacteriaceae bacterium]|nr:hypothetical protein [Acidobacteriaceae bacterium]